MKYVLVNKDDTTIEVNGWFPGEGVFEYQKRFYTYLKFLQDRIFLQEVDPAPNEPNDKDST